MKKRLLEARLLLAAVGVLQLLFSLFVHFSSPDVFDPALQWSLEMAAVLGGVAGLVALASARLLPRHPRAIATSVLILWMLIQLTLVAISPFNLLRGALLKFAMLIVLVRGAVAGRDAEAMKNRLRSEALNQPLAN